MKTLFWFHVFGGTAAFIAGLLAYELPEDKKIKKRGARGILLSPIWEVLIIWELIKTFKKLWRAADWKGDNE